MSKRPKLAYTTYLEMVDVTKEVAQSWNDFKEEVCSIGVTPETKDSINVFKDGSFEVFFNAGTGTFSRIFESGLLE